MKIILNQDVDNLGEEGDVCEVAPGHARNYLIPKKLAVLHNKQNVALFEGRKALIEKKKGEKRRKAQDAKERIEQLELVIPVPVGESGKLFGSVNNATIAEELKKEGVIVERKRIDLPENVIKMVGEYIAQVKLYDNEAADLKISVIDEKKSGEKKESKTDDNAKESGKAGELTENKKTVSSDDSDDDETAGSSAVDE